MGEGDWAVVLLIRENIQFYWTIRPLILVKKIKALDSTKILICHLIILKSEKLSNTLRLNDIDIRNIY